jgi:hypothetical protein
MHDEDDSFGWDPENKVLVTIDSKKAFEGYPFPLYTKEQDGSYKEIKSFDANIKEYYSIANKIHCFEFLNNASALANFLSETEQSFE